MSSYHQLLSIIKLPGLGSSPSFWMLLAPRIMRGYHFLMVFVHITQDGLSKTGTSLSLPQTSNADFMLPTFLTDFYLFDKILTMLRFGNMAHNTFHCTTWFLLQLSNSVHNFILFSTANHDFSSILSKLFSNCKPYPKKKMSSKILRRRVNKNGFDSWPNNTVF